MPADRTSDSAEDAPVYVVSIKRAAELLEVSEKTIQRRMHAGELEATTVAGKRAVKVRADQLPEGASIDQTSDTLDSTGLTMTDGRTVDSGAMLATVRDARGAGVLAAIVAETLKQQEQARPSVPIEAKLMLTVDEAAALSGVGRTALDAAIRRGELKAHRGLGRGRRLKRADLEKWAGKL
jgi:excisionase family DNA binding protein